LSELGRHHDALQHAQAALVLLQSELLGTVMHPEGPAEQGLQRVASMAVCYHNLGVELEFSYQGEAAVGMYQKGLDVASNYLGEEHRVTSEL